MSRRTARSDAAVVELTTAPTAIEAEWIVGALMAQGVRAVVFDADYIAVFPATGPVYVARVMVRDDELESARKALAAIRHVGPS